MYFTIVLSLFYFKLYLKERGIEKEGEHSLLLVHFLNVCNSQGRAKAQAGSWGPHLGPPCGRHRPNYLSHCCCFLGLHQQEAEVRSQTVIKLRHFDM